MAVEATTLVLGRGEVYFAPQTPGAPASGGEFYIGNTPQFSTTREVKSLECYDSYDGQIIQLEGPITKEEHVISFSTDNINRTNFALWNGLAGARATLVEAEDAATETIVVSSSRHFQLGTISHYPHGARNISELVVKRDGIEILPFGNFEVDMQRGRISFLKNGADLYEADSVTVTYSTTMSISANVVPSKREFFGSLRYISKNPLGPQRNYFYPLVKLSPAGEWDHKPQGWQIISFEAKALRLSPLHEYVYAEEQALPAIIVGESTPHSDGTPFSDGSGYSL